MALEIGGGITIGGNITVQIETGGTSPVNTVAPVVSGTATVGQTLSTTNGTWTGTATITFTYQWQRNGVDITSATSGTYTLVAADVSNPIRCVVTGTNTIGNSSANSNATANVAAIAPGAPTIGTATATGTTTATVAFTAPGSNGGATITTYTATSSPDNITGTLSQAGSGTINMTGLTAGTSYTFTVTATNSAGTGSASSASNSITTFATPVNTVAPVVSGTATVGQTLSTTNGTWTGTATITFTYQWQRNGVDITSATSGTYTLVAADASNPIRCVVTGTNSYGNSSANSNATASVAAIAPGAPTIGAATATGESTATVAFTAPASNGGATITTYTATSSPAGGTGTLSQAGSGTITVTGLTQATSYTFTVTATNSVGTGSASAASNSITTTASYFNYNTLLLPGASTTFVDDASTNNFALTINGDTRPNNLNPYSPGYYSNYFDGTGDYLSLASTSTLAFGTGDFCVEMYYYQTTNVGLGLFSNSASSGGGDAQFEIQLDPTNLYPRLAGWATVFLTSSVASPLNVWNHLAVCRSGTTASIFLNGTRVATATVSNNFSSVNAFNIGRSASGGNTLTGYMSNVRAVKGSSVYDPTLTTLTVPTTPLTAIANTSLLTCQSNRFIDNSSNEFTLTVAGNTSINSFQPFTPDSSYSTYGSGYFDGTGDYLTTSNINFSTNPYTIEGWFYVTASSIPSNMNLWGIDNGSGSNPKMILVVDSTQFQLLCNNGSPANIIVNHGGFNVNTWYHVAVVKQGTSANQQTIYLNGVALNATSPAWGSLSSITAPFNIGYIGEGFGTVFQGYISNFRIVNGTAVYTTTFTPPSAPLTAIANTSLLTLQNNQSVNNNVFLDNSSNNLLVTRNGNTTQGTFSPYGGNWSNYFDGSGDYLSIANSTAFDLPGDFTIQCWLNLNVTVNQNIIAKWWTGGEQWVLQFRQAGQDSIANQHWRFVANNGSTANTDFTEASTTSVATSTWYHIALTRSGSSYKLFRDGTQVGSTYTNAAAITATTDPLTIGQFRNDGVDLYNGYISNLQIVKGTALYTSAFTPPTTPLTPITNTSLLTCADGRFIDDSINNFTVTTNGNTSVQRFSPFNPSSVTPTSYSGYFDGTGDYLTTPITASGPLDLGSGSWTVEAWVMYTGSSLTSGYRNFLTFCNNSGLPYLQFGTKTGTGYVFAEEGTQSTVPWSVAGTTLLTSNVWHHIATVRNGNNIYLYLDGVLQGSVAYSGTIQTFAKVQIGSLTYNGSVIQDWTGYVSNARIVNGVAVYTGAFTVPTSPLAATQSSGANIAAITGTSTSLLTLQSTTFIDNSTNNFTLTAFGNSQPLTQNPFGYTSATTQGYTVSTIGGSGYFEGGSSTGYLALTQAASNIIFPSVNSGGFTIEFWFFPAATSSTFNSAVASAWTGSVGQVWWEINCNSTGFNLTLGNNGFGYGSGTIASSTPFIANQWAHVVVQRRTNGTNWDVFQNGVNVSANQTSPNNFNLYSPAPIRIAYGYGNTVLANLTAFYLTDFKITNSQVYTASFVPPAAPLSATQNTNLLLNMTSGGIIDYTMMNNMETVGNASLSTTVTKYGATSLYFDGTGDYISLKNPGYNYTFYAGNWTIESWIYTTSSATAQTIFLQYGNTADVIKLYCNGATGTVSYQLRGTNQSLISADSASSLLSLNTWTHIAMVRDTSTTIKIYVSGTLALTATIASTTTFTEGGSSLYAEAPVIGAKLNSTSDYFVGYMDDFRITKGYAYYTTTFTPPTAAFPTY